MTPFVLEESAARFHVDAYMLKMRYRGVVRVYSGGSIASSGHGGTRNWQDGC